MDDTTEVRGTRRLRPPVSVGLGRRPPRAERRGPAMRSWSTVRVLIDLAVMLDDGGDAISDLPVLREQPEVFGSRTV